MLQQQTGYSTNSTNKRTRVYYRSKKVIRLPISAVHNFLTAFCIRKMQKNQECNGKQNLRYY